MKRWQVVIFLCLGFAHAWSAQCEQDNKKSLACEQQLVKRPLIFRPDLQTNPADRTTIEEVIRRIDSKFKSASDTANESPIYIKVLPAHMLGTESWNERVYEFHPAKQQLVLPPDPGLSAVVAHEWGHVLICDALERYSPDWRTWHIKVKEWAKLFNSLMSKTEEDENLASEELSRYMAVGPRGAKNLEEYFGTLNVMSQKIEAKNTERRNVSAQVARELGKLESFDMERLSLPYQELFADVVAVADSGNPNAVSEAISGLGFQGWKIEARKFLLESNEITPPSGAHIDYLESDPHVWFAQTRRFLWTSYLSKPANATRVNALVLAIEKAVAEEIFERHESPLPRKALEASLQARLLRELVPFQY